MSNDRENNSPPAADVVRNRRNSVTSAAFSTLFQKSNSTTSTGTPVFPAPGSVTSAAINEQRRRLSISTIGLSAASPADRSSFGLRRSSMSTNNSDSIDESAIDEEDMSTNARTAPTTPFARRMSFGAQAMRSMRSGPGNNNTTAPGSANDQGFNWSEQLRSRAESNVAAGSRPSFSFASGFNSSPPRASVGPPGPSPSHHDRAKSVSDMPAPPAAAPKPRQDTRPKPDHFQERILKGDFYMD